MVRIHSGPPISPPCQRASHALPPVEPEGASAPGRRRNDQPPKSLPVQKALTLLKHATSEAVIGRIIEKLSPDDVLSMLPEIENKDLADRLILHSLAECSIDKAA